VTPKLGFKNRKESYIDGKIPKLPGMVSGTVYNTFK
jgi:hypothetical protein